MADIKQFQRSKDRITEIMNTLMLKNIKDEKTCRFIDELEKSIRILDAKMQALFFESNSRKNTKARKISFR